MKRGKPLRRTPLARGGSVLRRTPLARGSAPLQARTPLPLPAAPIRYRSPRAAAEHTQRMDLVRSAAGHTGRMLCQFPGGCGAEAGAVDERVLRSQLGGAATDEGQFQFLCPAHHAWKHANPVSAEQLGLYERGSTYRQRTTPTPEDTHD